VPAELNSSIVGVNQVTVSFDARGGTPVNSIIVDKGSYIDIPESTKIGHTLEGWYTSLNNGVSLDQKWDFFATPININLALFANWNTNQYTITFVTNYEITVNSQSNAFGSTLNLPTIERTGYTFEGWFTDENLTQAFTLTTMPAENLTLYAKWTIIQYKVIVSYEILLLEQFVHVSGSHAVTTNGRLYGWGRNDYGQVGDGETIPNEIRPRSTPKLINFTGLQSGEIIQIVEASLAHTLAVTTSGRVYAWGRNFYGALGDGTTTNRTTPTLISFTGLQSGETIQSVEAGGGRSLALTTSGRVYAWGYNPQGQVGDGTTTARTTPTLISFTGLQSGEIIQSVAALGSHALALTTSGRVYAWGVNNSGQLGDGTTTWRKTPTLISFTGLQSGEIIKSVAAGVYHSLAVTTSGRVYAWGNNNDGELGDDTTTDRNTPTLISFTGLQSGEIIKSVAAGVHHSLAVTTSSRLYAWGNNTHGQLGDGTTTARTTPTLISFTGLQSGETIKSVVALENQSLAVTTSGRLYAWGNNSHGQLGDNDTTTARTTPTIIKSLYTQSTFGVDNYLTVAYNQAINLPNPTLEGYVFEGWFMDKELTVAYNVTLMPSNDVILYAKFTPVVS
jgi:uncharacterized repeat protein (TIGR02543 family)